MSTESHESPEGAASNGMQDSTVTPLPRLYEDWFLDYASYVILERAVPSVSDGLKPVQRRILHAMKVMDDGRFNKVANVIGSTMQYHPHGDASIGDAIVNMGQKDLLIETQGNWGDPALNASAAAPRYIEARLSKFALDVAFNPQTTEWQISYDGRKKEPVTLPLKFPLLLAHGAEGIAVGLATRIMPHNFCELLQACIDHLRGKPVDLMPDFPTGGMADCSNYKEGLRGGKVRLRARIEAEDPKTLVIKEIPYGTNTDGVMDSIVKANNSGKIKIKKVTDVSAQEPEIHVQLAPGQSPDVTIAALYAFTDCEASISPNCCVIEGERPRFVSVNEALRISAEQTRELLRRELEIRRDELMEKLLFSSLEKIFIENRIYRDIEECETFEAVIQTIDKGLEPYKPQFYREILEEDILKLTEIKIKRISKYDSFKADEQMRNLEEELAETNRNLENLTDYAVAYFKNLLKKYGKGRERKTELRQFDTIAATQVAANNAKLYVNRKEGFIGYGLKKDEFVQDCSDIDDVIVFLKDGKCVVTKIGEKVFVGKNILHCEVFVKGDERKVYNLAYMDGATGVTRVKRFQILSVTRDRVYDLTKGTPGSKVLYFTSNPNGEAETVSVRLNQSCKAKNKLFDFDFAELEIKGRGSQGNILSKYPVKGVILKQKGGSTLGGLDIWYDAAVGRLNTDGNGEKLGKFDGDDQILVLYKTGEYELTGFDLTNRYEPSEVAAIGKHDPESVVSTIHYDGKSGNFFAKRFQIETKTLGTRFSFLSDHKKSKMLAVTTASEPEASLTVKEGRKKTEMEFQLSSVADLQGYRTLGAKLSFGEIAEAEFNAPETSKPANGQIEMF